MKLLHFILIFLLIAVVYSQDGSSREILSDSLYEQENRKSIESMMIWKLTEELELEVDQAEKFFQDLGSIERRWRTCEENKDH